MRNLCNKEQLKLLAAIVLMLGICTMTMAQEAQQQEQEKVLTPVQKKMQQQITVDFRDTPIDDVIRVLAKQADMDIVKGPDVTGNVTAALTDVPLEEAMNQILAAYGYGFIASENMIRIVPASQLTTETERTTSKIYRIVYADVKQVEQALTKVVSKRGYIASSPGSSNIIVTDTESNIKAIDEFVAEIDRVTPQILVEVRIYDITNTDSLDLGVEWSGGRNTGYGSQIISSTGVPVTPVTGYSRTDPFINSEFNSGLNKASNTDSTLNFGVINSHVNIDATITAAAEKGSAKLLANPRILVLDNETASFKSIREIPYQQLQQGGYQSFGTTEFKEVGVELEVTPHLATDGLIRLHIRPVFSVYVTDIPLAILGLGTTAPTVTPQPVVDKREADTLALVRDNETVVIGGLKKQEVTKDINKIPLLGDLPLLGWLFKFEGDKTINSELVVFITPRIIEKPVLTETESEYLKATDIPKPVSP